MSSNTNFKFPGFHSLFLIFLILFLFVSCNQKSTGTEQGFTQTTEPEIIQFSPEKSTKIELRRNVEKEEYKWTLKGDNVEDIIKTDKRLREYTSTTKKKECH